MYFQITSEITDIEIIAKGRAIRDLGRLRKKYGPGRWRKFKGRARVQLEDGSTRYAEIHWYEALYWQEAIQDQTLFGLRL